METIITFRLLERSDVPLLRKWLAAPHVAAWWNEPFDTCSVEAKYGPTIDAGGPMHVYVVEHKGTPIGWVQWYRWRDFPEHAKQLGANVTSAGMDLAIGEVDVTGLGLGPVLIREFVGKYIFINRDISAVVADPATMNLRSVSAFKKAGFNIVETVRLDNEPFARHVVLLDRGEATCGETDDETAAEG